VETTSLAPSQYNEDLGCSLPSANT